MNFPWQQPQSQQSQSQQPQSQSQSQQQLKEKTMNTTNNTTVATNVAAAAAAGANIIETQEAIEKVTTWLETQLAGKELAYKFPITIPVFAGGVVQDLSLEITTNIFSDGTIAGFQAGNPLEMVTGYDARHTMSALSRFIFGQWKYVDEAGLFSRFSYKELAGITKLSGVAWVLDTYRGPWQIPVPVRRMRSDGTPYDVWASAWGSVDIVNGVAKVAYVAADKLATRVDLPAYRRNQNSFGMLSSALAIVRDGSVWVGASNGLAKYYFLLWNYAKHFGVDAARSVQSRTMKAAVVEQKQSDKTRAAYGEAARAAESGVDILATLQNAKLGELTLEPGKTYVIKTRSGIRVQEFTWNPTQEKAVAMSANLKSARATLAASPHLVVSVK